MASFRDCFWGDCFGEALQELVFSLEMRCTWLFSKEVMLPVSSSVLEMLPEPSRAASRSAPTEANHCIRW